MRNIEIMREGVIVESLRLSKMGIVNATSTKKLGNMSVARDSDETAQVNFNNLLKLLKINPSTQTILFPELTHSANVALVANDLTRKGKILINQQSPEVKQLAIFEGINPPKDFIANSASGIDACISNSLDMFIAILPADCAPVMLYDPVTKYYAMVHSGVLGTFSGIVINTINSMISWCGTNPSDVICYLGPCVTSKFYRLKKSGLWNSVLKDKITQQVAEHFELKDYIKSQLLNTGVLNENISVSQFCTGTNNELFYSNYSVKTIAEKQKQGRHISIIGKAL